jgi:hypothetical protein
MDTFSFLILRGYAALSARNEYQSIVYFTATLSDLGCMGFKGRFNFNVAS